MTNTETILRLLLGTLLAGAVGFERERHGRAAGFRTHMLVGAGSCLVMLTGLYLMDALAGRVDVDPTRMAAQVISGIGFLGAGTILRFRASVRGLTTAASLWAVGGIGLAAGAGFTVGAVGATVMVLVALFGLAGWERRIRKDWYRTLTVEMRAGGEGLMRLRHILAGYDVEIRDLDIQETDPTGLSTVQIDLKLLSGQDEERILREVLRLEGTRHAHWV